MAEVFVLPKPKVRRQLHISALQMLSRCGQQFQFRYILGKKQPPGIFTLVGTSTHRTIHHDLNTKIKTGMLASDIEVKDIASTIFDSAYQQEPVEPTEDDLEEGLTLASAKDKAIGLAMVHHQQLAPILYPVAVERPFSLSLDRYLKAKEQQLRENAKQVTGYARDLMRRMATAHNVIARDGCDFAGTQDVIEAYPTKFEDEGSALTVAIRDTKTGRKSPNKAEAEHSLQLTAYALASNVLDGRLPDKLFLDYLIETPALKERYVKSLTTVASQNDVDMFMERVSNAVYALHSGVFVPARTDDWWCSKRFCGYFGICPYAKRPAVSKPLIQIDTKG